jgi:hypothetical protein
VQKRIIKRLREFLAEKCDPGLHNSLGVFGAFGTRRHLFAKDILFDILDVCRVATDNTLCLLKRAFSVSFVNKFE